MAHARFKCDSPSGGEIHFNTLWVDVNRDGKLTDNEKLTVTSKEIRGKWWSSFDTIVDIPVPASEGRAATTRPHSLALWYVDDPQEPTAAPTLRWSRRGWHVGQVELGGTPAYVLITEMAMDGKFDQRDSWAVSRNADTLLRVPARGLDEHYRIDGDDHHGLKVADKVDGYPTLILLDANGKELRRGVGYQSVLEMLELLKL